MRNLEHSTRTSTWAFLAAVAAFITYGSLFPFDFHSPPRPLATLFSENSLIGNAADAFDNFLLFIPLGFVLRVCFRRTLDCLVASLLAILLLGLGIQLIQLYLPSRTASLADVFWNGVGLGAGLLLSDLARKWFGKRLASHLAVNPYALLLVFLWFFYESFPFIPTLDYGLLRDHVKTAIFAPPFETLRLAQHLLAALLGGIALQRAGLHDSSGLVVAITIAFAVLLEILVPYGSLRRETLLGMSIGLPGGFLLAQRGGKSAAVLLIITAAAAFLMTVATPYRGQAADAGFTLTPFSSFFWRSVTRDLPPIAFEALAIGSLLWAGRFTPGLFHGKASLWVAVVFFSIAALEAIRVLAIGYHGDTTTLLIAAVLAPFAAGYRDRQDTAASRPVNTSASEDTHHHAAQARKPASQTYLISIVLLAAIIFAVVRLPGIPYNLRELLPPGMHGAITALGLSAAIFLAANSPLLVLRGSFRRLALFPLLLPLQGAVIWLLLRIGVPLESIHDIVGTPVLGWPWEWEMFLRFLALHQAIATQMVGAVLFVAALCRPALIAACIYWLIASLLLSWPLYLVVVEWAATDNLVELIRDGGSFIASSLLAMGILFTFVCGASLGAALAMPAQRRRLIIAALVAPPLSVICFLAGLEPVVVKYGKVFSAAQFLLSPDREHYLSPTTLWIRFASVYALAIAAIAMLQLKAWAVHASLVSLSKDAGNKKARR